MTFVNDFGDILLWLWMLIVLISMFTAGWFSHKILRGDDEQ